MCTKNNIQIKFAVKKCLLVTHVLLHHLKRSMFAEKGENILMDGSKYAPSSPSRSATRRKSTKNTHIWHTHMHWCDLWVFPWRRPDVSWRSRLVVGPRGGVGIGRSAGTDFDWFCHAWPCTPALILLRSASREQQQFVSNQETTDFNCMSPFLGKRNMLYTFKWLQIGNFYLLIYSWFADSTLIMS